MPGVRSLILLAAIAQPPSLPLTFEAVLTAAGEHPELEARDAQLEARAARDAEISRLSANPQAYVLPGWRLPGSSDPGFEIQFGLSQSIDLGGIGGRRRASAAAERAEMRARRKVAALEARLAAAHAWLGLWARQAQAHAVETERDLAQELATRIRRATTLGAALETEAAEAEIFAQTLERAVIDAEGLTYEQALLLSEALGLPGARQPLAHGAPPEVQLPSPDEWPRWIARAQQGPVPAARTLLVHARRAQVAESEANASAVITPTIQGQWERPHDVLLYAGVSVQLPTFTKNERERAQAEAALARAEVDARRAGVDAERALRMVLHEVEHSRELEQQAKDEIVPRTVRWVEETVRRFEAGESEVFDVLRARRQLTAARAELLEAERARRWAEVKAWLLLSTLEGESNS